MKIKGIKNLDIRNKQQERGNRRNLPNLLKGIIASGFSIFNLKQTKTKNL